MSVYDCGWDNAELVQVLLDTFLKLCDLKWEPGQNKKRPEVKYWKIINGCFCCSDLTVV